jgi:hypothetical protein
MSEAFWVALIAGLPPTLTALATLWKTIQNSRKIAEVHVATNGMKKELEEVARQRGVAQGVERERSRQRGEGGP